MNIPDLSLLQVAIISTLSKGPQTGKAIRKTLEAYPNAIALPPFYQVMKRLENRGIVSSDPFKASPTSPPERAYSLTDSGRSLSKDSLSVCSFLSSL